MSARREELEELKRKREELLMVRDAIEEQHTEIQERISWLNHEIARKEGRRWH